MDVTAMNGARDYAPSFDDDREVKLSMLILEREQHQEEASRAEQQAARAERRAKVQKEVEALEDAADAMLTGALVSAVLTGAGGSLQVAGGIVQMQAPNGRAAAAATDRARVDKALMPSGNTLSQLAGPMGTIAGGTTEKRYESEATGHREQAAQAQDRAQDARDQASRAERNGDRVFELLHDSEKAKNNHIDSLISRF